MANTNIRGTQRDTLSFIKNNGGSCSVGQLSNNLDINTTTARQRLATGVSGGFVERRGNRYFITNKGTKALGKTNKPSTRSSRSSDDDDTGDDSPSITQFGEVSYESHKNGSVTITIEVPQETAAQLVADSVEGQFQEMIENLNA
jgi:predicted transcriptional regulator